jgi:hypothetical protein
VEAVIDSGGVAVEKCSLKGKAEPVPDKNFADL